MQRYFGLLKLSNQVLTNEVWAFHAVNLHQLPAGLGLSADSTSPAVQTFQKTIADDYRLLGGSKVQLDAFAGSQIANTSTAPPPHSGDRPCEGGVPAGSTYPGGAPDPHANRRPELGFISLPREVVVALTEVGLVWGAIDFGGESGDIMHFDCRANPGC